jgi:hypothetical protein
VLVLPTNSLGISPNPAFSKIECRMPIAPPVVRLIDVGIVALRF